ncbi:Hypothetical predicted protein [Mytilus galloprovincialis]|uniref:Ig-like domain-containing protein n=2 Tax=Mytilus galloprovincialis TaxID=29158 RepID=A0A8B6C245_MYTGA|nr:Hypothetical predicted protein [Mytilus galloprovincialis]
MNISQYIHSFFHTISFIIIFKIYESYSITVLINKNISGVIGEGGTRVMCSYTRNDATKIFTIELKANNETVATFLPDEKPRLTTKGRYLEGRVTLMNISKVSTEAVMIFNNLTCDDQTNYSCSIVFLGQNGRTEESHSGFTTLNVKVPPSKPEYVAIVDLLEDESTTALQIRSETSSPNDTEISTVKQSTTSAIIKEGDIITCICAGNVGKPPGKLIWQKYRHGEKVPMNYTHMSTIATEVTDKCSYYGTSYLQLRVTSSDNQAIIRCFIDSPLAKPYMYVEMKPIDVTSFSKDMTTYTTTSSHFTGSEGATESHNGYIYFGIVIGIVIGVLALVLLVAYGIYLFKRKHKEESTNSNLCIIGPPTQQTGHCEIISMTNDIDKETSVGAAVTIDDPRLPTNENLARQEDKDNQTPTNTSPVTTVCVNAQLKEEKKSQMPNKDNKDQSGERTNTNNHSIEQNMIAEKESSL